MELECSRLKQPSETKMTVVSPNAQGKPGTISNPQVFVRFKS